MKNIKLFYILVIFQFFFKSSLFSLEYTKKEKAISFDYSVHGLLDHSNVYTPLFSISSMDAYYDENNPISRKYNFRSTPKLINQYSLEYATFDKSKGFYFLLGLDFEKWSFISNNLYIASETKKKTIEDSNFESLNIKNFIGLRHFFKKSIFTHKYKYEVKNSESFLIDSIHISDSNISPEFHNWYVFVNLSFLVSLHYEYFFLKNASLYAEYEFYVSQLLNSLPIFSKPEGFLVYRKNGFFSGLGRFSINHFEKTNFGLKYYLNDFLVGKIQFLNEIVEYKFKKYQEYYAFSFSDFSFNRNLTKELLSDFLIFSQNFKKQTNRTLTLGINYKVGWN